MEPVTLGGMITILCGAISTLFWLYTAELRRQIKRLEDELKATNDKVEETVKTGNESTRAELAELRKTNAELVEALLAKDTSS